MRLDEAEFVVALADEAATDVLLTGGKGANLARLVTADFTVPSGFCVTTAAYRALESNSGIEQRLELLETLDPDDVDHIRELSAALREQIRNAEFPSPIRQLIEAALEEVGSDSFAVRSSATAEDLPTASFAGQHETFLGINGHRSVLDRIRDCMASLFTERAVSYRLKNGVSQTDVAMAVVIQAMVDPDAAGVLFTADPVSGNRNIASVDANYGIGDSVVAGEVSPDNARIDRRTGRVLEYTIGEKRHALRTRSNEKGTGTEDVPPRLRQARVLSDTELRKLAELGGQIEVLFNSPQDIEWAIIEGEFIVLQSRPITTLFPLPSPMPQDDLLHVYFNMGHQQAMAEALPPLVADWFQETLNNTVRPFQSRRSRDAFAVQAGQRVFVDLTPVLQNRLTRRRVLENLGVMSEPAVNALEELLGRRQDTIPPKDLPSSLRGLVIAIFRGAPFLVSAVLRLFSRFVGSFVYGPSDSERVRVECENAGRQMAERIRQSTSQAERVRAAFEEADLRSLVLKIGSRTVPQFLAGNTAGKMLGRMFPEADSELDAIGKGFDDEIATQINQRLGDLADSARKNPDLAEALTDGASVKEMEQVAGGGDFLDAFEEFLCDFGHRTSSEIDLSQPRWKDDPAILLQTIRSNLTQSEEREHRAHLDQLKQNAAKAATTLENQAGRGLFGPVKKSIVRRLIKVHRGGIQLREHHKHGAAYFLTSVHDVISEAGESLAAEGRLERPADVWYLRKNELITALNGDGSLDIDIDERRSAHSRYASMTAPPILTSDGETPSVVRNARTSENSLVGTPVSSGVVEGIARVVHDPSKESLVKGEILVAPSTDVGWTPLFQNAAGLVMQVGGQMTHGALVAREYGIPAVVSVPNVTNVIQTGERIRIDGGRGIVERLDRSEE